ncbi:MAG: hypothetical protein Q8861_01970 [Bacteroidota bacterium]|nr:hypothetical protein [Bacteroidota bacterium]
MADPMKLAMVLSVTDKMSRIMDKVFNNSTKKMTDFMKKSNAMGKKMQKIGAGISASGTAITGGLFAAVKEESKAASEYLRTSQKVGMSVENWQRVEYAADRANVASESLRVSMQRFMKTQVTAAMGNKKAAISFKAAGVSIMDHEGKLKSSHKMLMEIADQFAKAPDGPKKTALAILLFGKAGADMIPMLNKGSKGIADFGDEATKFGLIMSTKTAKEMKAFALQNRHINDAMIGFKRVIAESALPVMTRLITKISAVHIKMIAFVERHRTAAKTIVTFAGAFGIVMAVLGTFLVTAGTIIRSVGLMIKIWNGAKFAAWALKYGVWNLADTIKKFAIGQKIAAAAQWLFNSALFASPITWIAVGIGALIAVVVVCWKKFAGFRAGVKSTWEVIKGFGSILKDFVIDRIKGIISGLGSMGKAIALLFKGKFAAAGQAAMSGIKDLSGISAVQTAVKHTVTLGKSMPGTYNRIYAQEKAAEKPQSRAVAATRAHIVPASNVQRTNVSNAPTVHYAPTIHVNGGSPTVKQDLTKILNQNKDEIARFLKNLQQNNNRLSFGYNGN